MEDYTVRPATADDIPFVFDSWLNSWRTSKWAGVVRNCDYYSTTRSVIEDLIARGAVLLVADAGPTLLGWVCAEEKDGRAVLHYLYTKDAYLRLGVEERLLDAVPGVKPGFFTFYLHRFAKSVGWSFAPEIARRKSL